MDITVKPELEKIIEQEVSTGQSADAGQFLDKAVYHYIVARDLGQEFTREEIDEKIARGLAQVERGETIDGDEFFRDLLARGERQRRSA